MKLARIAVVALVLTLLAASTSFGAVIAFRTGTLNEISVNAQTGLVGNIGLVPLVSGTVPTGEIVNFTYTYPISSVSDLIISVGGVDYPWASSSFGTSTTLITGFTVTVDANHIALAYNGAGLAAPAGTAIFQIAGVRVNVFPTGAPGDRVGATITSALGQVAVTAPDVDVAVLREPLTVAVVGTPSSSILTTGGTASATIAISELFTNGYESKYGTNQTRIKLVLTVPATLTYLGAALNTTARTGTDGALLSYSITAAQDLTATTLYIDIDSQDPNALETIPVVLSFRAATTPVPLSLGSVTVQATLNPPTTTFPVAVGAATGRLRFGERLRPTPALAINFGVTALTSKLLSLFNVTMAAVPAAGFAGYETGIAIQNASTILDVANPGAIKVTLYKSTAATPVTFTTSATIRPGTGLDAAGMLQPNGTWSCLLSQLLTAGGVTGDWEGMVYFEADFSGGTGINYVADPLFATQAQGYQMVDTRQWRNITRLGS